jgi:uncharacterized membrane protein
MSAAPAGLGRHADEKKPTPALRAALLLGPVLVTASLWFVLWLFVGHTYANQMAAAAGAALFGLGNTVILGPAVLDDVTDVSTWDLAWMSMYLNAAAGFFYAYNLDLLQRLPWIGARLRKTRANAARSLTDHPWIRRWATVGVGVFVLLPLPGSGTLGGCVVARLIGFSHVRTWLTVTVAGAGVCGAYAWFGSYLHDWVEGISMPVKIAGLVVVFLALWLAVRALVRLSSGSSSTSK